MDKSKCDISLNLRGTIIHATRAILTRFPESVLGRMFNPELNLMEAAKRDGQGNYLMDHDPEVFKIILANLRSERFRLRTGGLSGDMWDALEVETDYFCLTEMQEQVKLRRPIRIHVEGTVFTTNRGLLSRGGKNLLRVADDVLDDNETVLLKRDPKLFGDIMYYLSVGDGSLFGKVIRDHEFENQGHLELLDAEATYWGVWDLCEIVRRILCEMNPPRPKKRSKRMRIPWEPPVEFSSQGL